MPEETPIERLIAFIEWRMSELGIPSRRELARLSGMDPGSLGNIMVGRVTGYPSRGTLERLAHGLSRPSDPITADFLFKVGEGEAKIEPPQLDPEEADILRMIKALPREQRGAYLQLIRDQLALLRRVSTDSEGSAASNGN